MTEFSYGWEKLHTAVHSLAGESPRRQRLVDAIIYNLIHINPERDIPVSMRADFERFMAEVTAAEPKGDEGSVQATVNGMDDMAVARAIERIISFYDTVCRHKKPN